MKDDKNNDISSRTELYKEQLIHSDLDYYIDDEEDETTIEANLLDVAIDIKIELVDYINKNGLPIAEYLSMNDLLDFLQN